MFHFSCGLLLSFKPDTEYNANFDAISTRINEVKFLADRTNGRAIGTVFRLSVCRLCDVMYCG